MTNKKSEPIIVTIPALDIQIIEIELVGDSRIVINKWSQKAIKQMEDKRAGKALKKKAPVRPQEVYEAAMYVLPDGTHGFPASGFKGSAVSACRHAEGLTMVKARGIIFVEAEAVDDEGNDLVIINGDGPHMRCDPVRLATGVVDLRYRPEFRTWRACIRVRYNANIITAEQVVNLFNLAGHHVGVGEGRPERSTKDWGRFHVATGAELEGSA